MNAFVALIMAVHVLVSIGLIVLVLLHSGKGTGVSSMFSGMMSPAATGTGIVEKNLSRFTIGAAIVFTITTFLLMITY